jgi:2-oxoglutarate ferredoxin oxidoreductase subunit alpha
MSPVILLTDGYLANGSEPWLIPSVDSIPEIPVEFHTDAENFQAYARDENLVRPWAIPGTKGLEHRIGGLEKANISGDVSYDPDNHFEMIKLRQQKIQNMAKSIPDLKVDGDPEGELLVIGWGGTYGAITEAVQHARKKGYKVSQAHFKYINPFPKNTESVLRSFKKILLPEINMGQLARILKSEFLLPIEQFNIVRGLPFRVGDIENKIIDVLGGSHA